MKEFPERDGRPLPLRYWTQGDVLLHWRTVEGDVVCVKPFHAAGTDRTALCLRGRPLQIRDGLDGKGLQQSRDGLYGKGLQQIRDGLW